MDQTDLWMAGVVAFGLCFYGFALYFQGRGDYHRGSDDQQQQHGSQP